MFRTAFITPCQPTLRPEPPSGDGWIHEVKFDGFRLQAHKEGKNVALFSRGGTDWTDRYRAISDAVARLPVNAIVLDAELTAHKPDGSLDFGALLSKRRTPLGIWIFDVLFQNGKDLRPLPLRDRRKKLNALMARVQSLVIRPSEVFPDPHRLLAACKAHRLEGIVSKRADTPYRSGPSQHWIKVKCPEWREENRWRHEFFARKG